MYLLEETPEAEALRQNLLNLFYSGDEQNIALACQMLEGGGVHPDFQAVLCVVLLHISFPHSLNEKAKELLQPFLNAPEYHFVEHAGYVWSDWEQILEGIEKYNLFHDEFEIAKAVFRMFKEGVRFCYRYGLVPFEELMRSRQGERDVFMLEDFKLEDLPPELAYINVGSISLEDCPLTKLSAPTWHNPHISTFRTDYVISRQDLRRLCHYFPNYSGTWFKNRVNEFQENSNQYLKRKQITDAKIAAFEGLNFARWVRPKDRDKHYYFTRAVLYSNAGYYRLARLCFVHLRKMLGDIWQYQEMLYELAVHYAFVRNKPCLLETLAHFVLAYHEAGELKYYDSLREAIMCDKDFQSFHQDKDLLELLDAHEKWVGKEVKAFMAKYIHV